MLSKMKFNTYQYITLLAIGFAVFTQFPAINKEVLSRVNFIIWLGVLALIILPKKEIHTSRYFNTFLYLVIVAIVISMTLVAFQVYTLNTIYVYLLPIPIAIYYVSFRLSSYEDCRLNWIDAILKVYCVICLIMALQIAIVFITNFAEWSSSLGNMYVGSTHKNSTGQVIGAAFLVQFFYFKSDKFIYKVIKTGTLLINIMALLYVQSRAAIIAICISILVSTCFKKDYKKALKWIFYIVICSFVIYKIDFLRDIVEQVFFIEKYSQNGTLDVDKFSSGRLRYWDTALKVFSEHFIVGIGNYYVDNFYINVLVCGGLVLGIPFLLVYLQRVWMNLKLLYENNRENNSLIYTRVDRFSELLGAISIFYLVISFFEAYPPYGPGVSCMLFWLLSGYADGYRKLVKE